MIKHINGMINEMFTAGKPKMFPLSIIIACIGGNTEPPSIAMISPAAPNLVSSPNSFSATPYMVGNISDIHPEIATNEYIPYMFFSVMAPIVKQHAATANVRNK